MNMNTEELVEKYTAQGKPWIIMKSYTSFVGETYPCYHIVVSPHGAEGKEITKREMSFLVEKYDMVLAFDSKDGKIWELPGCPFREKYSNVFGERARKSAERKREKRARERMLREMRKEEIRRKRLAEIQEKIRKEKR